MLMNVNELQRRIKNYNCNIDINIELQNTHEEVASPEHYFIEHTIIITDANRQGYLFDCSSNFKF